MKRARTDSLTGGTKDVNPQFLSTLVTMTVANTAVEQAVGTPIVRVGPETQNTAIILEVLKLFIEHNAVDLDAAAATVRQVAWSLSTQTSGTTAATLALSNPRVIMSGGH